MDIQLPDLDIGRCKNRRAFPTGVDNITTMVRCNDYEGVPHTCTFTPPPVVARSASWSQASYTTPKPKRWVKPTERADVLTRLDAREGLEP
jgi:hypothetical protein